jgi:hypothetical protein
VGFVFLFSYRFYLLADVGEWEQEKQHAVEPVRVYDGRIEEKQIV